MHRPHASEQIRDFQRLQLERFHARETTVKIILKNLILKIVQKKLYVTQEIYPNLCGLVVDNTIQKMIKVQVKIISYKIELSMETQS